MRIHRWVPICVAVVGVSGVAHAATIEIHGLARGPLATDPVDVVSQTTNIVGGAQVATNGVGGSQYLAAADFGLLGALSGAEAEYGITEDDTWFASGIASWDDTFRIVPANPARLATTGTFAFQASVAGSGGTLLTGLTDSFAAFASWGASVRFFTPQGQFGGVVSGQWTEGTLTPPTYSGDPLASTMFGTVSFLFGEDIRILGELQTGASALAITQLGSGKVEAYASFINTLTWGGFTELRDADGLLLSAADFALVSDSQTDWSIAVPEPSSGLLALAGFVACSLLRRRSARA